MSESNKSNPPPERDGRGAPAPLGLVDGEPRHPFEQYKKTDFCGARTFSSARCGRRIGHAVHLSDDVVDDRFVPFDPLPGEAAAPLGSVEEDERNTPWPRCPITNRPFFMNMDHPDMGEVPTFGGPFDSYTIPEVDEDGELRCERYDHDAGDWLEGGVPLGIFLTTEEPPTECLPTWLKVRNKAEDWVDGMAACPDCSKLETDSAIVHLVIEGEIFCPLKGRVKVSPPTAPTAPVCPKCKHAATAPHSERGICEEWIPDESDVLLYGGRPCGCTCPAPPETRQYPACVPQGARYWHGHGKDNASIPERLFAMEQAYNHVVNALAAATCPPDELRPVTAPAQPTDYTDTFPEVDGVYWAKVPISSLPGDQPHLICIEDGKIWSFGSSRSIPTSERHYYHGYKFKGPIVESAELESKLAADAKDAQPDGRDVAGTDAVLEEAAKVAEDPQNISMIGGSTGDAYGTSKRIADAIRALKGPPAAPMRSISIYDVPEVKFITKMLADYFGAKWKGGQNLYDAVIDTVEAARDTDSPVA